MKAKGFDLKIKKILFISIMFFTPTLKVFANPWSELAINDLKRIHDIVYQNHPGPLDKQNSWFNSWFSKGYTESVALAKTATTYQGYYFSLKYFVNGFKDGHLHYWTDLAINRVEWPGFTIAKRGDKYFVHHVSDNSGFVSLPKKGAQLLSCDGKTVSQLMEQTIFPYNGNKDLATHWIKQAPMLFVDFDNPFENRMENCKFKQSEKTKLQTIKLTWKKTRFNVIEPYIEKAGFGSRPTEFAYRKFGSGNHWISIPTFGPDEKRAHQLENIIGELGKLRNSNIIVFDVRGNGGGNSQWGNTIVEKLYGEAHKSYRQSLRPTKSYVEWRTSPGNLSYLQKVVPSLKKRFGQDSSIYRVFNAVAVEMKKVKESVLLKQLELDDSKSKSKAIAKSPSPVKAKVYFLTDGYCGSACLDFADILLNMEGVIHIGLPTSADTVYMDIRREKLPSSVANLSFAMKVYRDRLRGNNQPYTPVHLWEGDIWDTRKLEKWIFQLTNEKSR